MNGYQVLVFLFSNFLMGNSANILGLFTFPSLSHHETFRAICKELAFAGHNLTIITPHILNDSSLPNIKEIDINQVYGVVESSRLAYSLSNRPFTIERVLYYLFLSRVPTEIAFERVKILLSNAESYDLLLVQGTHPLNVALAAKFKAPVIGK